MKQTRIQWVPLSFTILLSALTSACAGGGGGDGSGATPVGSTPSYSLSPEQTAMKNAHGYPDYLTISIDADTGRREEAWIYKTLGKSYIYWDGKRAQEDVITVSSSLYSNPPVVDPTNFTTTTKLIDIQKLFGTNHTEMDQSQGALAFKTLYYPALGLSVSFSGDRLVVVQSIDKQ